MVGWELEGKIILAIGSNGQGTEGGNIEGFSTELNFPLYIPCG